MLSFCPYLTKFNSLLNRLQKDSASILFTGNLKFFHQWKNSNFHIFPNAIKVIKNKLHNFISSWFSRLLPFQEQRYVPFLKWVPSQDGRRVTLDVCGLRPPLRRYCRFILFVSPYFMAAGIKYDLSDCLPWEVPRNGEESWIHRASDTDNTILIKCDLSSRTSLRS